MSADDDGPPAAELDGPAGQASGTEAQPPPDGAPVGPPTGPARPPSPLTGPVPVLPLLPPVTPMSLAEPVPPPEVAPLDEVEPALLVAPPAARRRLVNRDEASSPPTAVRTAQALTVLPPVTEKRSQRDRSPSAVTGTSWLSESGKGKGAPEPVVRGHPDHGLLSPTRNAAIMAAGTTFSRVTGFARVLAVGWVLGQERLADAYNQANTIPNTVYDLLLGGVLSATLLPVLMQSLTRRNGERDEETVPAVATFITVVLVVATGIFWLAAPEIIRFFLLLAEGGGVAAERALATTWLRLFTPQLLFIGLITLTTALLNARRRFASVAFSPALANLVTIAALVVAGHLVGDSSLSAYRADRAAVLVVGLGTTAGYLVQLLAQLPALFRADIPLRPRWHPRHPALRTIARLSGWTVGAVAANQVSFILVSVLANEKGGNLSSFMYAYTFMQLPYAIIAVSIAYAVAPDLAELWSAGNKQGFANTVGRAMRVTVALILPAGVGYALLARPAALLALAHGHLTANSAELTGSVLSIFALGLPGFSAYLLLMRAFQAKQDTRSMFWLYAAENLLTVLAALALYPAFGVRGLAAAWIGSYTVVLPLAWRRLKQSAPITTSPSWLARALVATGVMAAVVAGLLQVIPEGHSIKISVVRLLLVTAAGAGVFVVVARALGLEELSALRARYRALVR